MERKKPETTAEAFAELGVAMENLKKAFESATVEYVVMMKKLMAGVPRNRRKAKKWFKRAGG